MADISKLTLPSGTTYNIKDAQAREDIASIEAAIAGGVSFIGKTTTPIEDGSTTNPIVINDNNHTAISGNLVVYGEKEFIFDGTKWIEFGDLGSLGALAFKDSATGNYIPNGTVGQPTFTGDTNYINFLLEENPATTSPLTGVIYQPKGTVSKPTFTGTATTIDFDFAPKGTVTVTSTASANKTATVSSATGTATYTPGGTVSQPTFSGNNLTSTGSFTPSGSVTLSTSPQVLNVVEGTGTDVSFTPSGNISFTNQNKTATVSSTTGTATYTPGGSVAAPVISVSSAGSTTTVKNPTSQTVAKTVVAVAPGGTAPSNNLTYYSVSGETLSLYQLGYTVGDSITTSNVTVKSGDATYTASAPTFTGTGVRLVTGNIAVPTQASFNGTGVNLVTSTALIPTGATFAGTSGSISVSGTPSGTVSQPTFSGTGVRLVTGNIPVPSTFSATFAGDTVALSTSYTPNGTITQPTFTGTKVLIDGNVVPTGTVSQPTFTGTSGTVTVS